MKRYRLLKDLPTFDAGEVFFIDEFGNLVRERDDFVAYSATTLKKFPNILEEWFAPEGYYYIRDDGFFNDLETDVGYSPLDNSSVAKRRKEIGNYFETKEEAERAVERLRAWKRLKDKGFRFEGYTDDSEDLLSCQVIRCSFDDFGEESRKDLDLLFGGEE